MATTYSGADLKPIPVEVFEPNPSTANGKAVVVAYGTEGLNPPFDELIDDRFCKVLAGAGFHVARPEYFVKTNTTQGTGHVMDALPQGKGQDWIEALVDAVTWVKEAYYSSGPARIGLVGFSLGGNLVLHAAPRANVNAVVDFFGPIDFLPKIELTQADTTSLPPTQIHHGTADQAPGVPYSQSVKLDGWLTANGITHDFQSYLGEKHPSSSPTDWKTSTQDKANQATIAFLDTHL